MNGLIHVRDFIYLNKRFLDKGDDLLIYNNLTISTPYDIYLNGSVYGLQISLQSDIPVTIKHTELLIGYNEIQVGSIIFGITKGYDETSNIVTLDNCTMDDSNIYTRGESFIHINKNSDIEMNGVLNIHDILDTTPVSKNVNLELLGSDESDKLHYGDIVGNIDIVNMYNNNISKYKYFRIEFDISLDSNLKHFRCLGIDGVSYSSDDNPFSISYHNLVGDIPNTLLYNDEGDIYSEVDTTINIGYIEFTSDVMIYGFEIFAENIKEFRVYGKRLSSDEYIDIFTTNSINSYADYTINFKDSYISSFKVGDDIYTIGTDGVPVINSDVISFDDSLSILPPMSDDNILPIIQNLSMDDVIFHKDVDDLVLKEGNMSYGIIGTINGEYINNMGSLVPDLYVHKLSSIDLSLFPSNSTISYYIKSDTPMILNINRYPVVSYKINNKINLDKYILTPDFIHDEYTLLKIQTSNEYKLKSYMDISINGVVSDSLIINNSQDLQKVYDYTSNHIKVGQNIFVLNIEDMLGNRLKSGNIILTFNNEGPSISIELDDYYITGTISDSSNDKTKHTIYINDEPSSYNNIYREVPYSFKYEWDNSMYSTGDNINIKVIADDTLGGITDTTIRTKIVDKGIIFMDRNNRHITDQKLNQLYEINLGLIISNNPPGEPFLFKIKNLTGYDINNALIYKNIDESIPANTIIDMGISSIGEPVIYSRDELLIPSLKEGEVKTILYKLDGSSVEEGNMDSNITLSVSASIR